MREKIRQFISELSQEEQVEIVHALVANMSLSVKVESAFVNSDGVVVGYYVPFEKWMEDHPSKSTCSYKNEEEACEAAKNGPSLSEVIARLEAAETAKAASTLK